MSNADSDRTIGQSVRAAREARSMSRATLGGLVGRSSEWVKAVETGRLLAPRLPMLVQLAQVLGLRDLAELTGDPTLPVSAYTRNAHDSLSAIADVLTTYQVYDDAGREPSVSELAGGVRQGWELWHGARRHRTAVATVLPGLLDHARQCARHLDGADRRRAQALRAQVHHMAQLYLSFQPRQELVYLSGDRAMTAAQDADDPHAIASAAWYLNHVFRDAGEAHEARVDLAAQAGRLLQPESGPEDLARFGLLELAVALSYGKVGRDGDAWRHWDAADRAARALGDSYAHPWLVFGRGMVDGYAVTLHTDLMHPGEAVRAADRLDFDGMPSMTRRSFHLIETARAYHQRRESVATVHLLRRAWDTSPETARFNVFAQRAVADLAVSGGSTVRAEAVDLAAKLGVPA